MAQGGLVPDWEVRFLQMDMGSPFPLMREGLG